MKFVLLLILGSIGLLILISIIWRFFSHRSALPCPVWLSWMVEIDNPFTKTNRAQVIIEHLELKQGMNVLDAGCGPGRLTIPLAHKVGPNGTVVALDLQHGMLNKVTEKMLAANLKNIKLVNAGIGEGKLSINSFDRALLVTVLGEIPNQESAMKELFAVLKPGGILSVTEVIFDPHFQSYTKIKTLAQNAGFKEKKRYGNRYAYTAHFEKL